MVVLTRRLYYQGAQRKDSSFSSDMYVAITFLQHMYSCVDFQHIRLVYILVLKLVFNYVTYFHHDIYIFQVQRRGIELKFLTYAKVFRYERFSSLEFSSYLYLTFSCCFCEKRILVTRNG